MKVEVTTGGNARRPLILYSCMPCVTNAGHSVQADRCHVQVLTDLGLVTEQELQASIATEFNPVHIGFHSKQQRPDIAAEDVLNLGISPK